MENLIRIIFICLVVLRGGGSGYFFSPVMAETYLTLDLNSVLNRLKEVQAKKICTPEETLVVFDIDETLITNKDESLSELNLRFQNNQCVEVKKSENQLYFFDPTLHKILRYTKLPLPAKHDFRPTQEDLGKILKEIQERGDSMALTARYGVYQEWTLDQLKQQQISFPSLPEVFFDRQQLVRFPPEEVKKLFPGLSDQGVFPVSLLVHKDLLTENLIPKFTLDWPQGDYERKILSQRPHQFILLPPTQLYRLSPKEQQEIDRQGQFQYHYSLLPSDSKNPDHTLHALSFHQGVLLASRQDKGVILRSLLEQTLKNQQKKYRCLFFVDDTEEKIVEVEEAFHDHKDFKTYLFHYRRFKNPIVRP